MPQEIIWQAPEFEHWHKPGSWYLALFLVSLIVFLIAIAQGNFLFAVFVVIAVFVVSSTARRSPRELTFRLTERALVVDDKKVYPYEQLAGFAIQGRHLILQRKRHLAGYLKFLHPTERSEEIRHFLNTHLPEIEYEESLSDHFFRWLRF